MTDARVRLADDELVEVVRWMYEHLEHGSVSEALYRKLLRLDEKEYGRKQDMPPPNENTRWDCVTMGEKCYGCPYYHVLTEGVKIHECPRGIRIRYRRIG